MGAKKREIIFWLLVGAGVITWVVFYVAYHYLDHIFCLDQRFGRCKSMLRALWVVWALLSDMFQIKATDNTLFFLVHFYPSTQVKQGVGVVASKKEQYQFVFVSQVV